MKKWLALVGIVLLTLIAYLALWPVPIAPVVWHAPTAPGYTGVHATNNKLQRAHTIALNGETGPEHVVVGPDGKLYFGVESGRVMRMRADGSALEIFSATGGRPLGLAFDGGGRLIVADARKGLMAIDVEGEAMVLADTVAGEPIRFADAVIVARNGNIYFTDASMRFAPAHWGGTLEAATLDILEQSATGRVLVYEPETGAVRVVANGLSFANGIALASDERSLFVAESGRYRVWQITVAAQQLNIAHPSVHARVLLDNLPGYPDNLMRGQDGRIWLGLAGQRNDLDAMAQWPFLRKLILRVPRWLWALPKPYGHVLAFTEDGKIVDDIQDPSGNSPLTTGVTETPERFYIHNANAKSLGWLAY